MKNNLMKKIRVMVLSCAMAAVVAATASAANVTATKAVGVHQTAKSSSTVITTMNAGASRKILNSTNPYFYKIKMNGKTGYVRRTLVFVENSKLQSINTAVTPLIGKKYKYGGNGPKNFDVSGFCQYVYKQKGITIPRTVATQYLAGVKVSKDDLKKGDLVFYAMNAGSKQPAFDGIYLGNGNVAVVSTSKGVTTVSMSAKYYSARYITGVRINTGVH